MALPNKLKHLNIFTEGDSWIGVAEAFTPAKLTMKTEAYQGAGMPAPVDINLGLEGGALNTEFTFGGYAASIVKKMHAEKIDAVSLRFAGSFQRDDTGEVMSVEIYQRGRIKEIDRGEWKTGDNSPKKVSMLNTYYKEMVNGEVVVEIDAVNNIHIVDGKDMMEAHRKAIGL